MFDIKHAVRSAKLAEKIGNLSVGNIDADKLTELINDIESHSELTSELSSSPKWNDVLNGLYLLKSSLRFNKQIKSESNKILAEKERLIYLKNKFLREISSEEEIEINKIFDSRDETHVDKGRLVNYIQSLDLPSTYLKDHQKQDSKIDNKATKRSSSTRPDPLVRLVAFLDDSPLVGSQTVKPQINYTIKFNIRGIIWPDNAIRLEFDLLTTLSDKEYSVSKLYLPEPEKISEQKYKDTIVGNIKFKSAQTIFSEDICFKVRGAFRYSDGSKKEVPIIGHNELKFHVLDPTKTSFTSGYDNLDSHLHDLVSELIDDQPTVKDELNELLPLLEALTNLLGHYSQSAVFKEEQDIKESEFQNEILKYLRMRLGEEVKEHPQQGGGITDLVYKNTVVELKVEKQDGNRKHIGSKYSKQATQYQGSTARQVSVVLVLDLTKKVNPPGDIRNNILLVDVPTHGGKDDDKRFPSKGFIFVIDGNQKSPSEYSK